MMISRNLVIDFGVNHGSQFSQNLPAQRVTCVVGLCPVVRLPQMGGKSAKLVGNTNWQATANVAYQMDQRHINLIDAPLVNTGSWLYNNR